MYERFTDRARKVMQLANQEAQRFNHEYIGTEHVLLGLVKEGSGVAAVFENVGDPTMWGTAFKSLARGGRLVTVGSHGGGMVTLDLRRLYQNRLQVISGLGGEQMEDLERSLQMAAQGELRLLIHRVRPLREAEEAHRLVEKNESVGKVVLDPTL